MLACKVMTETLTAAMTEVHATRATCGNELVALQELLPTVHIDVLAKMASTAG